MAFKPNRDGGKQAVAILATAIVLLFGAAMCAVLVLVLSENPRAGMISWAVLFTLVGLVVLYYFWPRNSGNDSLAVFWWTSREVIDPAALYQPKRKSSRSREPVSLNAPPSAEQIRELNTFGTQWVPRGPAPERNRDTSPRKNAPRRKSS